jgi:hypothetical protein
LPFVAMNILLPILDSVSKPNPHPDTLKTSEYPLHCDGSRGL